MDEPKTAGRRVSMLVLNRYTNDTRVEKEAATLTEAGYRVTVVAEAGPSLPLREVRNGVEVVRVARRRSRVPLIRLFAYARQLEAELVAQRPDILHAHDSNALLPIARAARRLGIPFVYDAHDLWTGRPRRGRSRLYFAASQLYFRKLERRLLPRAAAHLTVSPPIARYLERAYRLPEVTLVPNYPPAALAVERRELRSLPGGERIPDGVELVLYIGGLMAERGIEQLVRAMGGLPAAHLVLLGEGVLAPAIRELATELGLSGRVHLLAPVPTKDVVAYAASASIGVSPIIPSCLNYRYSLPNKLFQYMAAGIPVVASDFDQIRHVVLEHGAGYLVDMTNVRSLAAAIGILLGDPDRASMGRNGRAAIATSFNWGVSADALLAVYQALVVPPASPDS